MDRTIGFLESEFDKAVAAGDALADNVIALDGQRGGFETIRERERRFRALLDSLPAAIYTTDAAGRLTYFNETAVEMWGYRPALGSAEWCGSWKLYWPDGTPLPHDESPMAVALKENRKVRGAEAIAERPDGSRVPFIPYPTPLHDESGALIGAVNMLLDITERKRAENEQNILMRELHHRVRNTLAIAQAIVGSTAKTSTTVDAFKDTLIGRIGALARTHLLLGGGPREAAPFITMLRSELDPFDDGSGRRIALSGPEVYIAPRLAVMLGMAIHEMTTNSAKYGALSVLGGRVEVTWSVIIDAEKRSLKFDWVESGGPPVSEPERRGFGSQLLEHVLPRQIHGTVGLDYATTGVRISALLPLPGEAEPKPSR